MSSRRWLARLTVPVIVSAALTTSTAIALADIVPTTLSLSKMHSLGFTWPSGDDADIVAMGNKSAPTARQAKRPDAIPPTSTPHWA